GGMVIREMMIGQIPNILVDRQLYVVPAIVASISVQLFYDLGWQSVGLAVSALLGIALGVAAYWLDWSVPGVEALAPVDSYFTRMKHRVGDKLPPVSYRQRAANPTLISAPTRKDVRDELAAIDGDITHDEFIAALYRAYGLK
ncbi:hypothetical protein IU408_29140, partial [Nocardia cyriacigeorgica]|nr:hypothetical protein [Nocardia cyriacigeorgica]